MQKKQTRDIWIETGDEYAGYEVVEVIEQNIKHGNGRGVEPYGAYHDTTDIIVKDECEECGCNRAFISIGFYATTHKCSACGESNYPDNILFSEFI
jgi:hypothetical protein